MHATVTRRNRRSLFLLHFKSSKFYKFRRGDQLLLFSMKFSDDNKNILFCNRAVSDDLEGNTSTFFLGQPINAQQHNYGTLFWHILFDLLWKFLYEQPSPHPHNPVQLCTDLLCNTRFLFMRKWFISK